MTLLLAGHETTATALAWTLDLLTRHPAALARLRAELATGGDAYLRAVDRRVAAPAPGRPAGRPPAGQRAARRRARPARPAPTSRRRSGWRTPARESYPEPYAFRPERFLDRPPSTYAWIPFGGGVRRCLGAAFAEMEMRVVLTEVLRHRAPRAGQPGAPSASRGAT